MDLSLCIFYLRVRMCFFYGSTLWAGKRFTRALQGFLLHRGSIKTPWPAVRSLQSLRKIDLLCLRPFCFTMYKRDSWNYFSFPEDPALKVSFQWRHCCSTNRWHQGLNGHGCYFLMFLFFIWADVDASSQLSAAVFHSFAYSVSFLNGTALTLVTCHGGEGGGDAFTGQLRARY